MKALKWQLMQIILASDGIILNFFLGGEGTGGQKYHWGRGPLPALEPPLLLCRAWLTFRANIDWLIDWLIDRSIEVRNCRCTLTAVWGRQSRISCRVHSFHWTCSNSSWWTTWPKPCWKAPPTSVTQSAAPTKRSSCKISAIFIFYFSSHLFTAAFCHLYFIQ